MLETFKHPATLVTALYYSSYESKIGGRGWDTYFYFPVIKNIINLGAPLVVYTHEHEKDKIEEAFEFYQFNNYKIVVAELENLDHHHYIMQQKVALWDENNNYIGENPNDRNFHICLNKFNWLNTQIEENTFDSDYFFWIDIGLAHHGIFPTSYGGVAIASDYDEANYYPRKQASIFRERLLDHLMKCADDNKFWCCALKGGGQNMEEMVMSITDATENIDHVVGGLFGGKPAAVTNLYQKYNLLIDHMKSKNLLYLEEPLLSALAVSHPESFNINYFDTWYHSVESDENYIPPVEGQTPFYEVFLNLIY